MPELIDDYAGLRALSVVGRQLVELEGGSGGLARVRRQITMAL